MNPQECCNLFRFPVFRFKSGSQTVLCMLLTHTLSLTQSLLTCPSHKDALLPLSTLTHSLPHKSGQQEDIGFEVFLMSYDMLSLALKWHALVMKYEFVQKISKGSLLKSDPIFPNSREVRAGIPEKSWDSSGV